MKAKNINDGFFGMNVDIEEIIRKERKERKQMVQGVIEKLYLISFKEEKEEIRVRKILGESRGRKEIVDFLEDRKSYRDFVVVVIKRARYAFFNLKIEKSDLKALNYEKRQEILKIKFGKRFIESKVIVVNQEKTSKEVENEWQEILRQFKKS